MLMCFVCNYRRLRSFKRLKASFEAVFICLLTLKYQPMSTRKNNLSLAIPHAENRNLNENLLANARLSLKACFLQAHGAKELIRLGHRSC